MRVKRLRQAVLQLAVMGKIVSQAEADDSSEIEPLREATSSGLYPIPKSWKWTLMEERFEVTGGITKNPKRAPRVNHFPYLRVANVQRGRLELDEIERFELSEGDLERWRLEPGDLLIVEGNGSETEIGRCAVWNGEIDNCVHQNHLIRCRALRNSDEQFTLLFLNSPSGMEQMKKLAITTSGLYSLSVGKIRSLSIPVPSVEEQRRIVEGTNALLKMCDDLCVKLQESNQAVDRLFEVTVRNVLEKLPTVAKELRIEQTKPQVARTGRYTVVASPYSK